MAVSIPGVGVGVAVRSGVAEGTRVSVGAPAVSVAATAVATFGVGVAGGLVAVGALAVRVAATEVAIFGVAVGVGGTSVRVGVGLVLVGGGVGVACLVGHRVAVGGMGRIGGGVESFSTEKLSRWWHSQL